jgi:hypothetical protein
LCPAAGRDDIPGFAQGAAVVTPPVSGSRNGAAVCGCGRGDEYADVDDVDDGTVEDFG